MTMIPSQTGQKRICIFTYPLDIHHAAVQSILHCRDRRATQRQVLDVDCSDSTVRGLCLLADTAVNIGTCTA